MTGKAEAIEARRWFISGRVQGVGFRWFVQRHATNLGLRGFVRNEDDGRVQVYAIGSRDQLNRLAARLHEGPPPAAVRSVQEQPAPVTEESSFRSE